jgi:hypothetical protein
MTIKEMSTEELAAIRREIECELTIRRNQQREELWLKIREAVANWYDLGGTLIVETESETIRIPRKVNLDTIGVFDMESCEDY